MLLTGEREPEIQRMRKETTSIYMAKTKPIKIPKLVGLLSLNYSLLLYILKCIKVYIF